MQIKSATGQTRWNGDYNLTITLHPSGAAYTLDIAGTLLEADINAAIDPIYIDISLSPNPPYLSLPFATKFTIPAYAPFQ